MSLFATPPFAEANLNVLSESGFISAINKPTRIFKNCIENCRDHFFIKTLQNIKDMKSFSLLTQITDHYPVGICIPYLKYKDKVDNKHFVNRFDYKNLFNQLINIDWNHVFATDDPTQKTN